MSVAQGLVFSFQRRIKAAMATMVAVTKKAAFFAGVALVAALGKATQLAARFQTQTSELAKLIGREAAEPLARSIRGLANVLPVAQERLLDVAAAASRLGVRGQENIEDFTRLMAEIGTATDASASEAADAMARMATATDTPVPRLRNLASAFNALSNTLPRTFGDIIQAAQRAAPELARVGATSAEIAGLSATLATVSASAARAGTRLRRLGQELQDTKNVEGLSAALGTTAFRFRQMVRQDPTETILRLARAFRTSREAADQIREALGSAAEAAIAAFAQVLPQLEKNIRTSNKAFKEGASIGNEFKEFVNDTAAQLRTMGNRLVDVAQTLGEQILPGFTNFIKVIGNNADVFQALLMPLASTVGTLFQTMADNFDEISGRVAFFISLMKTAAQTTVGFAQTVIGGVKASGEAFGLLITSIKGFILGILGFMTELGQKIPGLKDDFQILGFEIKQAIKGNEEAAKQFVFEFLQGFSDAKRGMASFQDAVQEGLGRAQQAYFRTKNSVNTFQGSLVDLSGTMEDHSIRVREGVMVWVNGMPMIRRAINTGLIEPIERATETPQEFAESFEKLVQAARNVSPQVQAIVNRMRALKAALAAGEISPADFFEQGSEALRAFRKQFEGLEDSFNTIGNELKRQAVFIGVEMARGLARGFEDGADFALSVLRSVALALVNFGLRKALEVSSPSQKTIPVGEAIVEGMVVGIRNMEPRLAAAASSLANSAVQKPRQPLRAGGVSRGAARAGAAGGMDRGQNVFNLNVTNEISALSLRDARRQVPALKEEIAGAVRDLAENSEKFRNTILRR